MKAPDRNLVYKSFYIFLNEANHGIHAPDYSVLGSTGSGAWIPGFNLESKDHVNPKRDINGDQQQCKDGEQIWKIHIFIRFEEI